MGKNPENKPSHRGNSYGSLANPSSGESSKMKEQVEKKYIEYVSKLTKIVKASLTSNFILVDKDLNIVHIDPIVEKGFYTDCTKMPCCECCDGCCTSDEI
jgi:hypothetical protein